MATMTYSNPGWTNGGPPALNKANLDLLSNALASIGSGGSASVKLADDATTVSQYGIGTVRDLGSGYNIDNLKTNGIYTVVSPTGTGGTVPSGTTMQIIVTTNAALSYISQIILVSGSETLWMRNYSSSTWTLRAVWNSYSDGNGGQPPAPRATTGTPAGGANAQGQFLTGTVAATNVLYYSGSSNLTGTWLLFAQVSNAGAFNFFLSTAGSIGSGSYSTISAGNTAYYACWRIA